MSKVAQTDSLTLLGGEGFGRYRIIRALGQGGMGVVYLAENENLRRRVALKLLHPMLGADLDFEERFKLEAQSVSTLYHPNVVQVHALERINGRLAIEMEYVDGPSLGGLFQERGVTPPQLAGIAEQILEGLRCCHDEGMVHRDLKPTNVLIDARGTAKLTDFGLVKMLGVGLSTSFSDVTSSAYFLGTPRYAPPEAWEAGEANAGWDLYALGCILYEGLTGAPVYRSTTVLALVKELSTHPVPPITTVCEAVSPEFAGLIDGLLHSDATKRTGSADAALDLLRTTREYAEHAPAGGATIARRVATHRPRKVRARNAASGRFRGWILLTAAGVGFVALTAAILLLTPLAALPRNRAADTSAPASSAPMRQDLAGAEQLPGIEQLPGLSKLPLDSYSIQRLVSLDPDVTNPDSAIILNGETPKSCQAFVRRGPELWAFSWEESAAVVPLSGGWAAYQGADATVLEIGEIHGVIHQAASSQLRTARLTFVNARTGAEHTETFNAVPADGPSTDTSFLLEIEREAQLTALLYNELLPRRIDWAVRLEGCLPALAESRTAVPWAADVAALDGELTEVFWTAKAEEGTLPGWPRTLNTRLMVRATSDALLLGIWIPAKSLTDWKVEIALQTGFPPSSNSVWRWRGHASSDSPPACTLHTGAAEIAGAWECEGMSGPGGWSAEMRLPYLALGVEPPVEAGQRWRLNAAVSHAGSRTPEARWGYPGIESANHGVVLEMPAIPGAP